MACFLPSEFPIVGVIHLPALPGSPGSNLSVAACLDRALLDARRFLEAGFDAVMVENFGDSPFEKGANAPHVAACLGVIAHAIRTEVGIKVGINCLRNDGMSALGAAAASAAEFIRVNVLIGVTATDQGIIEGIATQLLRYRRLLGCQIEIWADVDVKHGTPLFMSPIGDLALTAVERGSADAVIVTGFATGAKTAPADLRAARDALRGRARVFVGSGITAENAAEYAGLCDGMIVGSSCKSDGRAGGPVDLARARNVSQAIRSALRGAGH